MSASALQTLLFSLGFFAVYATIFITRRKLGVFASVCATVVAILVHLKIGITPPLPASVFTLCTGFLLAATAIFVTSDAATLAAFVAPIRETIINPRRKAVLIASMVLVPLLVTWRAWEHYQPDASPPANFRVVHPALPGTFTVNGETISARHVNPLRHLEQDDPKAFAKALHQGRRVYYQNCYFCHGDELAGGGHFAPALYPLPINFRDSTTIAMFTETFLFWRVAKGGPGLPSLSAPWDSAMPAWEDFLNNEEMWQVVAYLYSRTNQRPRVVSKGRN